MGVEAKDILSYIGIDPEKFESIDDVKKEFAGKFMTLDEAKQNDEIHQHVLGKRLGELETKFKGFVRDAGVEFDEGELKDKKLMDIMPMAFEKLNGKITKLNDDLKSASNAHPDAKVKELSEALEKSKRAYSDLDQLHKTTVEDLTGKINEQSQSMQQFKIGVHQSKAMESIKFKDGMSEIEKRGFNALLSEKLKFDFDDQGSFIVTDASGQRIQSKDKAGDFASPEDAIKSIAEESGVLAKPHANPHVRTTQVQPDHSTTPQGGGQGGGRKVSAAYLRETQGNG